MNHSIIMENSSFTSTVFVVVPVFSPPPLTEWASSSPILVSAQTSQPKFLMKLLTRKSCNNFSFRFSFSILLTFNQGIVDNIIIILIILYEFIWIEVSTTFPCNSKLELPFPSNYVYGQHLNVTNLIIRCTDCILYNLLSIAYIFIKQVH